MDKDFAQNVIKAQMDISEYLEDILRELAMDDLPEAEKKQMKQLLAVALEKFFIGAVADQAGDEQLQEMTNLMTGDDGMMRVMDYVSQHFDRDGELLTKVMTDFRREIVAKMKSKEN